MNLYFEKIKEDCAYKGNKTCLISRRLCEKKTCYILDNLVNDMIISIRPLGMTKKVDG